MTTTPWHTEKWFVSPWNYLPEVTGSFRFPEKIEIHDLTLRDGEQQAGILFQKGEKVRIAEALAELGVDRIEAGTPAVSREDEEAVREIARRGLGPKSVRARADRLCFLGSSCAETSCQPAARLPGAASLNRTAVSRNHKRSHRFLLITR